MAACGSSEPDDSSGGGASQAGSSQGGQGGGIDCSAVGCAPPPLCSDGCVDVCGCCSCAEGEIIERTGTTYRCEGGCYAPLAPSGDWLRFQVDQGWGPCAGAICANQWSAAPDGSVLVMREGAPSSATMPAADRDALNAIVTDPDFVASMSGGFSCEQPPTDVAYSLTLELADAEYVQDVTGCVLTGPAGNFAERAVELLGKY
jgi:hypothetical protein